MKPASWRYASKLPERRTNVRTIFSRSILASMIVGLFFVAACAKRPATTVSQAPAPAPAPAPRPAPTPAPPPAAAPAPPPAAVAPPPAAPRPAPKDYRPDDALKPINFAFDSAAIRPADACGVNASGFGQYIRTWSANGPLGAGSQFASRLGPGDRFWM